MRTHVCPPPKPMLSPQPQVQPRTVISGKPTENRDKTKLTCNGHCCRAAHNCANAVAGHALVGTRKGGGERKNSQSPLMNLDLLQVSVQSLSIMQPRDLSGRRVSRAMQNYRPTRFLDSRQWLRKKIRCRVYKGKFPVCKGGGE